MNDRKFSFWTNPNGFSIVDVLALSYSGVYLTLIISNIFIQKVALTDLLQTMTAPIMMILGGYFTGQVVQQFNLTRDYKKSAVEEEKTIVQKKESVITPPQKYEAPDSIKNQPYYKGDNTGFGTEGCVNNNEIPKGNDLDSML